MTDFLTAVDSDSGKKEPIPVTIVSNGAEGMPNKPPTTWPANTAFDARYYPDVEFQFVSGTVTVTRSLDGTNYVTWPVFDSAGTSATSAATPGIYSTDGSGWLKFSADVTVRAGA